MIENPDVDDLGRFTFNYNYSLWEGSRNNVEWERDPPRRLEILNSESYRGDLGYNHVHQFYNTSSCYFVNGIIDKNDGYFHKNFSIHSVGQTNVFVGPYPSKSSEVQELHDSGINAIINLQTKEEVAHMGIDWHGQMSEYRHYGIDTAMHFPISSVDTQYKQKIYTAAQYLNDLINNKGKKVFIHCTSGIVRAPTVVLLYLCLFKRVYNWQNPKIVSDSLVESHNDAVPQLHLVEEILRDNFDFQNKQIDIHAEKRMKRKEIILKFDQKAKILRELQLESEERDRAEIERQKFLAHRRRENEQNERRLDQESASRIQRHEAEVKKLVGDRQDKIDQERKRLQQLEMKIEGEQREHKLKLQRDTENFLADYSYKKQILESEINDAKLQRTKAQNELNFTKAELQKQRDEHARKVKAMQEEI